MEIILSITLLAIISVSIHQALSLTLRGSNLGQARFNCLIGANNLLEVALASDTPLLDGLRYFLKETGTQANLGENLLLPDYMQPGGTVGKLYGRLEIGMATNSIDGGAEVATEVANIFVLDPMTNSEVRIQAYRWRMHDP